MRNPVDLLRGRGYGVDIQQSATAAVAVAAAQTTSKFSGAFLAATTRVSYSRNSSVRFAADCQYSSYSITAEQKDDQMEQLEG